MRDSFEYDVALSFAGEDRAIARALANALRDQEVEVFYDKFYQNALWGRKLTSYFTEIYGMKSRFVIPLISKSYPVKDWTNYEFSIARDEASRRRVEFLLPVRLDETPMLGLHNDVGYLTYESPEQVVEAVLHKLGRQRRGITPSPPVEEARPVPISRPAAVRTDKESPRVAPLRETAQSRAAPPAPPAKNPRMANARHAPPRVVRTAPAPDVDLLRGFKRMYVGKLSKKRAALSVLSLLFEPNVVYHETGVNQIIERAFDATFVSEIRRDLVENGYLGRDPGSLAYWVLK